MDAGQNDLGRLKTGKIKGIETTMFRYLVINRCNFL